MLNQKLMGKTGEDKQFIEDLFAVHLYTGNGSTQTINNGIALFNGPANGVVLHLTGETLTDSAPIPNTITVNGNTQVSTSVKKYGTGSLYFDGTSKLTISNPNIVDIASDMTFECWIHPTTLGNEGIFGTASSSTGIYLQWYNNTFYLRYGDFYTNTPASSADLLNKWNHVAVVRFGNIVTLYLNGTSILSGTITANPTQETYFIVGDFSNSNIIPFHGYIDDFRVTKNVARYTANFTPPTAALPLDTLVTGGGMTWIKSRSAATDNFLFDTNRGALNEINSNSAGSQSSLASSLTAFNLNGFSLGSATGINVNAATYASWTFRKAPKFFDVVTYTGNGVNGRAISHSLGTTPGMVIIKRYDVGGTGWFVQHRSLASPETIVLLNGVSASSTGSNDFGETWPTASNFYVGSDNNDSGLTYVAYLFAHDTTTDGLIQCGSYTGNGSATGPSVTLGWEPQYLMIKNASGTGNWQIIDSMRGMPVGSADATLQANLNNAESSVEYVSPTATGFQVTSTSSEVNTSGSTYIYMAIRRGPMRTPTDGTKVFAPTTTATAASPGATSTTNFPVDLSIYALRNYAGLNSIFFDRLRGTTSTSSKTLTSSSTAAEASSTTNGIGIQSNTTVTENWTGASGYNNVLWNFQRAPGFFDVVCYAGNSTTDRAVAHNLGVVPEMIIVKVRNDSGWDWIVYHKDFGNPTDGYHLKLNGPNAKFIEGVYFSTAVAYTKDNFYVNANPAINASGKNYVAYLFASCPGVSKVGSFTGNGSTQTINCGFTNGARFVLIKRTDSTSNWMVWDTARGITTTSDPLLLLNSTAAETSGADQIQPNSTGFTVQYAGPSTDSAPNINGATYIYLAIA